MFNFYKARSNLPYKSLNPTTLAEKDNTIEIYLNIEISYQDNCLVGIAGDASLFMTSYLDADRQQFSFQQLAKHIKSIIDARVMQVGTSIEECYDIVNQHSHRFPTLVVKAVVPSQALKEEKSSEKELYGTLNAGSEKFSILKQKIPFSSENILKYWSMPRGQYKNSWKTDMRKIPEDFCEINEERQPVSKKQKR